MISVCNLSKHFGGVEVIRNLSLELEPSKVTALVGDNGAGKSTLLKILAGVYSPDRGEVLLDNDSIGSDTAAERRNRGVEMVFQNFALAPQQDVVSNLFMGREIVSRLGLLKRRAMRDLAEVKLKEVGIETLTDLSKPVGTLSGGQQQAVAIARALLFDPRFLLLDEPTAALAVREVERVLDLIRSQKKLGRTIVIVSHRLNDVFAVADRIVVLKQGVVKSDLPIDACSLSSVVTDIVS